jgi:chromosome segregation ATPase
VNSSIRDEINYLNEKKNKNDNSLVNALKKENKESNEEILNLKRENEHFKETVKKKDDEIEAILSEKEILNKKIEDFDRNQRLVIENNPPIQTVQTFSDKSSPSNVSMEIAEFLNKFQNRSKNI